MQRDGQSGREDHSFQQSLRQSYRLYGRRNPPQGFYSVYQRLCLRTREMAVISVKDTGIGISPENLTKLFKVSENFKTYGTNNEEGTGLGLILCKEFILKNNGEIDVKSKKGVGTTIFVRLPLL